VLHPARRLIVDRLRRQSAAMTVDEVSALLGVHRTVAHAHLRSLASAGLVQRHRRKGSRGKPAHIYSATDQLIEISFPQRRFQELAGLLAGALNAAPDGPQRAAAMGRQHGLTLAAGTKGIGSAMEILNRLGGDYEMRAGSLTSRNCIYREACAQAPLVVCSLQAGLIEGVLDGAGLGASVTPLGPAVPHGCAYSLESAVPDSAPG
jgi:predicted ArsR family transcriptional regulator